MGEFFKSWRRKLGVLTLALACILMAVWLRSLGTKDVFQHRVSDKSVYFLISNRSWLYWQRAKESFPSQLTSPPTVPLSMAVPQVNLTPFHFEHVADETRYFNVLTTEKFSLLVNGKRHYPGLTLAAWGAPYWSMVIPLTLLSAWLLLSKPRKTPNIKLANPISETVA